MSKTVEILYGEVKVQMLTFIVWAFLLLRTQGFDSHRHQVKMDTPTLFYFFQSFKNKKIMKTKNNFTKRFTQLLLGVLLMTGFFATGQTQDSVELEVQSYITQNLPTYQIIESRLITYRTAMQTECLHNNQPFSEAVFQQSMQEVKKYDLRKQYFTQNPNKLAVFNLVPPASPGQLCADGDFENWPIANPFVFKIASWPTNGVAQNIITTGTDFTPFAVGTTVDNFVASATLVSPGTDPNVPSATRVLGGNRAIKLNTPVSDGVYNVVTMSKNYTINQNNFDFNYSVLLNDPNDGTTGHPINGKPFFLVRIYDLSNNILRSINVLSNPADCSFTSTPYSAGGLILASGWRCARINTSALMGQTVRVEFIVADCAWGAHFGTVYIDNICNTNCATPLFGSIDLNQMPTKYCPTTNQTICGTYQIPQNSVYSNIKLNITQNGAVVSTIPVPTTLNTTTQTYCFTVPPSAFGTNPVGNFEFQAVGIFTRQCTVGFQLNPIYDNSANDLGADVSFINPLIVPTFNLPATVCVSTTAPLLPTTSINGITGTWSPATISNTVSATYTFTPAAGQCAVANITKTITITPRIAPTFNLPTTLCIGSPAPLLPTTSINGITGYWTPSTVSNTTSATYWFIPNAGQCTINFIRQITITPKATPTFNLPPSICRGATAPILPTTSTNGIIGTWSPAIVNNNTTGTYTFTPAAGQCGIVTTRTINVYYSNPATFNLPSTLCTGATPPVLPTLSTNGQVGTWSPATVSNTITATYTFTPKASTCAPSIIKTITIIPRVTPVFNNVSSVNCLGGSTYYLPTTSSNGITGTWNPTLVSNTTTQNYTFTPNASFCAATIVKIISVVPITQPLFNLPTTVCLGSTPPVLPTTSTNGITGTWSPSVVSNTTSGNYIFYPSTFNQCSYVITKTISVVPVLEPTFNIPTSICSGAVPPVLPSVSTNGIAGTWSPATIDNTVSNGYTFIPAAGQCGKKIQIFIFVENNIKPTFSITSTICAGSPAPILPTTSLNGITGTWSPATISNTATGTYTFTPTAGQCALLGYKTITVVNCNSTVTTCAGQNSAYFDSMCSKTTSQTATTGLLETASDYCHTLPNGILISGVPATVSTATFSAPSPMPAGISINPNGTLTIAGNTPPNNYNFDVMVCQTGTSNCLILNATFWLRKPIIAQDDVFGMSMSGVIISYYSGANCNLPNIPGCEGNGSVLYNDRLCYGTQATMANVVITSFTAPPGSNLKINTATGIVERNNPNILLTADTSTDLNYTICPINNTNPALCENRTVTIIVPNVARMANPNSIKGEKTSYINSIAITPNPSNNGVFQIIFNEPLNESTTIEVYNLIGQKVYETSINKVENFELSLEKFANGNYMVKIFNENQSVTKKIIKQ